LGLKQQWGYSLQIFSNTTFNLFSTILMSIMLEAMPFLLFGTFLSSLIEVFVSEEFFEKHIPKNTHLSLILASLIGLAFPVCECAIIPVAARLLKKGVPLHFAVTFVLAVPIINIPVILSTYYAFSAQPHIVFLRLGCGFVIAYVIGFLASLIRRPGDVLLKTTVQGNRGRCTGRCEDGHGHDHEHKRSGDTDIGGTPAEERSAVAGKTARTGLLPPGNAIGTLSRYRGIALGKISAVLDHTVNEFFETGKFLFLGALVTSVFQSLVPRSILAGIGGNAVLSTVVMVFFAYILSVCSQTDAFIARSFLGSFPQGSLVGFMVVGAMIDLKNTAMLAGVIRKKYIALFMGAVCSLGLIAAVAINILLRM
jgi:uncharacterized membrane protein YraQ (UPF0718 family)